MVSIIRVKKKSINAYPIKYTIIKVISANKCFINNMYNINCEKIVSVKISKQFPKDKR